MKRCSVSTAIRQMQIKTTKYHCTSTRMAIIKKITSIGEEVERQDKYTADKNDAVTLENSQAIPQKVKNKVTI